MPTCIDSQPDGWVADADYKDSDVPTITHSAIAANREEDFKPDCNSVYPVPEVWSDTYLDGFVLATVLGRDSNRQPSRQSRGR